MKKLTVAYLSFGLSVLFGYFAADNIPLPTQFIDSSTKAVLSAQSENQPTAPAAPQVRTDIRASLKVAAEAAAASEAARQIAATPSAIQASPTITMVKVTDTVISPTPTPTEIPTPMPTLTVKQELQQQRPSAIIKNDAGSAIVIPSQPSSLQIGESTPVAN